MSKNSSLVATLWYPYLARPPMTKCRKLEPAKAKKSELAWLGLARWQIESLTQAQIGLESEWALQAGSGSGSEGIGSYEIGSAQARTYIRFWAGLELGLEKNFLAPYILEYDQNTDTLMISVLYKLRFLKNPWRSPKKGGGSRPFWKKTNKKWFFYRMTCFKLELSNWMSTE